FSPASTREWFNGSRHRTLNGKSFLDANPIPTFGEGTKSAGYPIFLREESFSSLLHTTMAQGARRRRCWRSGYAFSRSQFLSFRKESSSRNHHQLCRRGRCLHPDDGKSTRPALAERQQGDRPRKWRSDFSRVALGNQFGAADYHVRELSF